MGRVIYLYLLCVYKYTYVCMYAYAMYVYIYIELKQSFSIVPKNPLLKQYQFSCWQL